MRFGQGARDLAARYAPILYFDDREPFTPQTVGYQVFEAAAASPSFPRHIALDVGGPGQPAAAAIEYAIWWDWDIGHLYELEHVWVYVGTDGRLVRVEASWHGKWWDMQLGERGGVELEGDRPVLYSQPGKHAFAPQPEALQNIQAETKLQCGRLAGKGGVWITPLFKGRITCKTPLADRLVHTYLESYAFEPAFRFTKRCELASVDLVTWPVLETGIPQRVAWWVDQLEQRIPPHERRWLRIAHRGASDHAPENTATAFRKAAALGADMVELDVQLSRDGVPIVIHDHHVDRMTNGSGPVVEHTAAELLQLRVTDPRFGPLGDEGLLTLEQALDVCRAEQLGVYVELKAEGAGGVVAALLQSHPHGRHALVGSFVPPYLQEVQAAAPEIPTAWLVGKEVQDVATALRWGRDLGITYLHLCWEAASERPDRLVSSEDVEQIHAQRMGLICWHEERPAVIAGLRSLGVDGVCSNRPELLC